MKNEIHEYLIEHRANDVVGQFGDGDSLLELGVIDSLAMVDLIAHLEKTYAIGVDEDDMIPENFDSVDAIAAYVSRKRNGQASSAESSATRD